MRQLFIEVARGDGKNALALAEEHGATSLVQFEAEGRHGPRDVVIAHVANDAVGALVDDLERLESVHITFAPQPFLALTPDNEPRVDVAHKSNVEIFLAGLQSVGSWRGFVGYAAASGVLVWIALSTNTIFLLVAAMLIAPFAGPAMNAALASARGAPRLLGRSLVRYFVSITIGALVAAGLSATFGPDIATPLMSSVTHISETAVLLPLVAGAAGALNLMQSERSNLVSGAATGMLVAASLAPPAGLVGMGAAIGRWDLVTSGAFLIVLQIVAINISGALVFRLHGVRASRSRYAHGKQWFVPTAIAVSGVALGAVLYFQHSQAPKYERASVVEEALARVQESVRADGSSDLVDASARFPAPEIPGQRTLLCIVYVQRRADAPAKETVRANIERSIRDRLIASRLGVTPLVDVTVLDVAGARDDTLSVHQLPVRVAE